VLRVASLRELGFIEGGVVEVVASTVNAEGEVNLSAMGASMEGGLVILRPFKETLTYSNLRSTGEVVLNLTDDPALFVYAALKLPCAKVELEPSSFVKPPRVKGAQGFVEAVVEDVVEEEGRARVKCRPLVIEARSRLAKAYCRAGPAIIEAAVHASRLEAYAKQGLGVGWLVALIEHYRELVSRVAPNTVYQRVMEEVWRWSLSKLKGG